VNLYSGFMATKASFKFTLDYSDEEPGGERGYEVTRYGRFIGTVGTEWLPSHEIGGVPVRGWLFRHVDGRWADGRSRQGAIDAALALPVPEKAVQ
jgi:hypothetical protein